MPSFSIASVRPVLLALPLLAVPFLSLSAGSAHAAAPGATAPSRGGTAMTAFKANHGAVVSLVKKRAKDQALEAKVDALLDYPTLAQLALGGKSKYAANCGAQCEKFESLLKRLIRANYLRMIRKAKDHPVEYVGEVKNRRGDAFKVTTKVKVQKNGRAQTVVVAYVMHKVDRQWQVRDIITDDVSLARTYMYEFNQILKRGGIDAVISKLDAKLKELGA